METAEHTENSGSRPDRATEQPQRSGDEDGQPRWPASSAFVALLVAVVASFLLALVIAVVFGAFGIDDLDNPGFGFAATAAQDFAFVAAALGVTAEIARPTARQFGFRRFAPSALGWALLALAVYLSLSLVYVQLAHPPEDSLPRSFGADQSTLLAVATGVLVVGVAPPVEEFFFRGFLYQALRARAGVWGAAASSGLIFGAIHLKPEFLVPLAILGMVLALLFQKTNSLWPCILIHAVNNGIAFAVTL